MRVKVAKKDFHPHIKAPESILEEWLQGLEKNTNKNCAESKDRKNGFQHFLQSMQSNTIKTLNINLQGKAKFED